MCLQHGDTFLKKACEGGNLEVVQLFYQLGGRQLLMMRNDVSAAYFQICIS
jgi:hypothetical protein